MGAVLVWCLLLLAAAIVLMCCAALTVVRGGSRAHSSAERRAAAAGGCRLGVISSLVQTLAGVVCLDSPAAVWGSVMILLGLTGASTGYLVFRRFLVDAPVRSPR